MLSIVFTAVFSYIFCVPRRCLKSCSICESKLKYRNSQSNEDPSLFVTKLCFTTLDCLVLSCLLLEVENNGHRRADPFAGTVPEPNHPAAEGSGGGHQPGEEQGFRLILGDINARSYEH